MTIAAPLIESGFICTAVLALVMDQNTKDVLLAGLPILSALGFGWLAYKGSVEAKARLKTAALEAEARAKIAEDVLAGNTKLEAVAKEVAIVKTATDGLTSKLLVSTADAAKSVGKDEERKEQEAREAERAKGSLAVKDSSAAVGPLAPDDTAEKKAPAAAPKKPA